MQRFSRFVVLAILALAVIAPSSVQAQVPLEYARGIVFDDANRNGSRDPGENGIGGVGVSNGSLIVQTIPDGSYSLPIDDHTIIFVIKPSGWMTPLSKDKLPRFFYIHQPKGSPVQKYKGVDPTGPRPESIDFPLYRQEEPERFKVVMLGDPQAHSTQEAHYLAHDLAEELVGTDAVFGVTLGDVVSNALDVYETVVADMGMIGIPWYNVKGNHDTNYDGQPDHNRTYETWKRVFGPPYYSFNHGAVHFIILNNPYFGQKLGCQVRLDYRQMSWLRRDLALVPNDRLVVLMMHIPINRMTDRAEIFSLLQDHPHTFSVSGHTHTLYQIFCGETEGWRGPQPHHHLVNGAACGAWFRGMPDEVGIPHSTGADGTPNGYSIITFDGAKYSIRWKVARRPADYQMNIFAPDEVPAAETGKTKVVANVFAGTDRSKIEMKFDDGAWVPMAKISQPDPYYLRTKALEDKITKPVPWIGVAGILISSHTWEALLPENLAAGSHLIQVRSTDLFGQVDTGRRIIFVR